MTIARPTDLTAALDAMGGLPGADLLAGGTDLMVEVNLGHRRPEAVVALRRVAELRGASVSSDGLDLGALVTYAEIEADLAATAPGLAMAARTVGSPQIRNAGTVGGNLGTASTAGDTLPWLVAMDATVRLASTAGTRTMPVAAFVTGPKRTALRPGELISRIIVPAVEGPQHVAKVGPRAAMAISIASVAVVVDTGARRVRVGLGSVGPTPLRATAAEDAISDAISWPDLRCSADDAVEFGRRCADAATPITDHRGTAAYRRHAVGTLATRALRRCLAA